MKLQNIKEQFDPTESDRTRALVQRSYDMFAAIESAAMEGRDARDLRHAHEMFDVILDTLRGKRR